MLFDIMVYSDVLTRIELEQIPPKETILIIDGVNYTIKSHRIYVDNGQPRWALRVDKCSKW